MLFNSVGYSINDLNKLTNDINTGIENRCTNHPSTINVQKVKDAISKLKLGKKEENGLFSNHLYTAQIN